MRLIPSDRCMSTSLLSSQWPSFRQTLRQRTSRDTNTNLWGGALGNACRSRPPSSHLQIKKADPTIKKHNEPYLVTLLWSHDDDLFGFKSISKTWRWPKVGWSCRLVPLPEEKSQEIYPEVNKQTRKPKSSSAGKIGHVTWNRQATLLQTDLLLSERTLLMMDPARARFQGNLLRRLPWRNPWAKSCSLVPKCTERSSLLRNQHSGHQDAPLQPSRRGNKPERPSTSSWHQLESSETFLYYHRQ